MGWSFFSGQTLTDISDISVLSLPIYSFEISNSECYSFEIKTNQDNTVGSIILLQKPRSQFGLTVSYLHQKGDFEPRDDLAFKGRPPIENTNQERKHLRPQSPPSTEETKPYGLELLNPTVGRDGDFRTELRFAPAMRLRKSSLIIDFA